MGRRATPPPNAQAGVGNGAANGEASTTPAPMAAAQKLLASADIYSEVPPDRFGQEAKHFTETRVLNREVSYYFFSVFICIVTVNTMLICGGLLV